MCCVWPTNDPEAVGSERGAATQAEVTQDWPVGVQLPRQAAVLQAGGEGGRGRGGRWARAAH